MENILINLTSDSSGLQPGIDSLVQMQVVDKELADQAKKTMDVYNTRNKATSDGIKQTGNDLEKLSTSFKNLDKSMVGGAYAKTLKELQKQIEGTSDEFKQLALAVDFAKKKQADLKPNTPEWKQLQQQIEQASAVLQTFGDGEGQTEQKTQSLRTQLRQLKQDIAAAMEGTGGKITPEIEVMIAKAGELDDRMKDINTAVSNIGSDTHNLDGLLSLASGGVGIFSAFQGAIALSGTESKEFEHSLIKLNAAMALLQGLQQVQMVLQKESAASQLILNAQKKIAVLTTELEAAAESKNIVVRYGAVAAQKVLNTVMAASPAGILLATIGLIAGAFLLFANNSKKAKIELDDLNRSMEDSIRRGDEITQAFSDTGKTELDNLQRVIDQRKAAGASETELLNLQLKAADKRKQLAESPLSLPGDDPEKVKQKFAEFEKGVNDQLSQLLTVSSTIDDINYKISKGGTEAEIEALKKSKDIAVSQYSLTKTQYDQNAKIVSDYYDSVNGLATATNDLQKHLSDDSLKSATAHSEALVLLAKAGTKQQLDAQIAAIRTREQEELANVNLTQGERIKLTISADKEIADLRRQYEKAQIEDAKKGIDAQATLAQQGSKRQLDLQLQSLQLAQGVELKEKDFTENAKLEIEAKYQKQRNDLVKAFNKQVAEDAISGRIAELQAQNAALALSLDANTNSELLANKKKLIDEEAALEVLSIEDSEKNEELRRQKIEAVYARALADKKQLERDKQKAEVESNLTDANSVLDREIARAQLILQNDKSTTTQRKQALQDYFDYQQDKLNEAFNANETLRRLDQESDEEYRNKKRELNTQQDQLDLEREQSHQAEITKVRELAQQTAINLTNAVFSIASKNYAAEEERVKALYDSKKISEQEYNNHLKQIRREQDRDAKAQALFTMLIEQGPTLLKGFQQGGIAGVAAAFTLFFALLGTLQSAKPPAYKEGKILIDGPGTETSDSINARLSKNESVIKASMSKKHEGVLRAINDDRYDQYLAKYELPKMYQAANVSLPSFTVPTISESKMQTIENHYHTTGSINYDKLADSIAKKLGEQIERLPQTGLSIDENGFTAYQRSQNDTINFKNKKLEL